MPRRRVVDGPNPGYPEGWEGGSNDFGFVRTFDGHLAANRFTTSKWADGDFCRNNENCVEEDADD